MTAVETAYAVLTGAGLLTTTGLVLAVIAWRRRRQPPTALPAGHEQGLFGLRLLDEPAAPEPHAPAQPVDVDNVDAELAAIVDDTATELTGAPASNPALGTNPLTGGAHTRRRHDPRTGNLDAAPVRRTPETAPLPDAAASLNPIDVEDNQSPTLPQTGDLNVANTLATAFCAADLDTLAALARQQPQHAAAAHLLAAAVGVQTGDPRFYGHLLAAWDTGQDPSTVAELGPFRDQLTFTVDVPDAHVLTALPCTRDGLALALAAAEYTITDSAAAYGILKSVQAPGPVGALLCATVALDLGWNHRAVEALGEHRAELLSGEHPNRWTAALAALSARAELHPDGNAHDAAAFVAAGLAALDHARSNNLTTAHRELAANSDDSSVDDEQLITAAVRYDALREDLHYLNARAELACGSETTAWKLLTALLQENPGHRPARDLLKTL